MLAVLFAAAIVLQLAQSPLFLSLFQSATIPRAWSSAVFPRRSRALQLAPLSHDDTGAVKASSGGRSHHGRDTVIVRELRVGRCLEQRVNSMPPTQHCSPVQSGFPVTIDRVQIGSGCQQTSEPPLKKMKLRISQSSMGAVHCKGTKNGGSTILTIP